MRAHTTEANDSGTLDERYNRYLVEFSDITKKILSRLHSHKKHRKVLIPKVYPDENSYTEIQNIINDLNKCYETPEVPLNQKKLDDLIQLVALLNQYVSRANSSSSMRSVGYKKSEKIAIFEVMTQLAVAMFFSEYLFVSICFCFSSRIVSSKYFYYQRIFFRDHCNYWIYNFGLR